MRKPDLFFVLKNKSGWVNGGFVMHILVQLQCELTGEILQVNGSDVSINDLSVWLSSVKKKKYK